MTCATLFDNPMFQPAAIQDFVAWASCPCALASATEVLAFFGGRVCAGAGCPCHSTPKLPEYRRSRARRPCYEMPPRIEKVLDPRREYQTDDGSPTRARHS